MKTVKILGVCLIIALTSFQAVNAKTYKCVGMDGEGTKLNVLYDEDTDTINVNGNILKVEAGTQGRNGVATEAFDLEEGGRAYMSLVVEGENSFILRQYNEKADSVMMTAPLACK